MAANVRTMSPKRRRAYVKANLAHIGILYSSYRDGAYKNTVTAFDTRTLKPVVVNASIEQMLKKLRFTWKVNCLVYGYKPNGSPIFEMTTVSIGQQVLQTEVAEFIHAEHMTLLEEIPLDMRCNVAWIGVPFAKNLTQEEIATLSDNFRLWDAPKWTPNDEDE